MVSTTILSFDIGIKNMSFCLLKLQNQNNSDAEIIVWENINLTESAAIGDCIVPAKNGEKCTGQSKFSRNNACYCLKHFKKTSFFEATNELAPAALKKSSIPRLLELCEKYNVSTNSSNKKKALTTLLAKYYSANCFAPIKVNDATTFDIIAIGRNMRGQLDAIFAEHLPDLTHVVIENQIGPLANKMSKIQGMVSQYFIMQPNYINIDVVSSANKLKDYIEEKKKTTYAERKKMSVVVCRDFIQRQTSQWPAFFNRHKKKDDLSDCLLQGLWFIKNRIIDSK